MLLEEQFNDVVNPENTVILMRQVISNWLVDFLLQRPKAGTLRQNIKNITILDL